MKLSELLKSLPERLDLTGLPDLWNHRNPGRLPTDQAGNLFIARTGTKTDGSRFAEAARPNGAVAALAPPHRAAPCRRSASLIRAAAFRIWRTSSTAIPRGH